MGFRVGDIVRFTPIPTSEWEWECIYTLGVVRGIEADNSLIIRNIKVRWFYYKVYRSSKDYHTMTPSQLSVHCPSGVIV